MKKSYILSRPWLYSFAKSKVLLSLGCKSIFKNKDKLCYLDLTSIKRHLSGVSESVVRNTLHCDVVNEFIIISR